MANKCSNEATGKSAQDGAELARPACRALPDVIGRQSVCDMCYVRDACALYHKGWENGTEQTSRMGPGFTEAVGHLSTSQMAYFRKWDRLLDLEDSKFTGARSYFGVYHHKKDRQGELAQQI